MDVVMENNNFLSKTARTFHSGASFFASLLAREQEFMEENVLAFPSTTMNS
jgi:hypothetical protein